MRDEKAKSAATGGPDLLQARMKDPVYARAFEDYRAMLIERTEEALASRRRRLGGRGPAVRRDAGHARPASVRLPEASPTVRIPEK